MTIEAPNWISAYWSHIDDQGNERDPSKAMIEWLSTQSPMIWHAFVTQYMNWDSAERVGYWILQQKNCDRATAAFLLFTAEPVFFLERYKLGEYQSDFDASPWTDSSHIDFYPEPVDFIKSILANFKKGYYHESNIQQEIGTYHLDPYRDIIQTFEKDGPPFTIPDELHGPFQGKEVNFPDDLSPYYNKEMWALIYALGTAVPNFEEVKWHEDKAAAHEKWCHQVENANLLTRMMWHPPLVIPHGPDFENEEERSRYIAGDKQVSKTVFNRAKRKIRAHARGENNSEVKKTLGLIAAMGVIATLVVAVMLALEGRLIS